MTLSVALAGVKIMSFDELFDYSDPDLVPDDQDDFEKMVERGTKAWADVKDATEWLEELRGNSDKEI